MNPFIEFQKQIGASPDGGFGPETLKKGAQHLGLDAVKAAHFFGQCGHESGGFTVFVENLNYSQDGLVKIFGKYFNSSTAAQYARQPVKIANRVYASRMGNGNEASGDGWAFRGRGAIQLTGRANYAEFSKAVKDPTVVSNPDVVLEKYLFRSAKWFFDHNNLWTLTGDISNKSITALTKRINGGTNGLQHRIDLTNQYYKWLT